MNQIIFSATGLSQKIFKDTGREYDFSKILFTFQKELMPMFPTPTQTGGLVHVNVTQEQGKSSIQTIVPVGSFE
jgi:hypothetical protein